MKQRIPSKQRGFVLLYVVVAITLVAAIAFALNNQGATRTNIASGELQRDQLRYVAEAGIAHATLQLSQSTTCDGYTDVPSTPFGAGTYTASITPTGSSPVTVTATGTLASGAEKSLSRDGIKVYDSSGFQRIALQPGAEGVDTYIEYENPSNNYGDQNILMSDGEEAGKGPIRSLLHFDLSGIPSSLAVVSAVLSVYVKEDANDEVVVEAHRLLQSWTEGTGSNDGATWNTTDGSTPWSNPGSDYDPAVEGSFTVSSLGRKSVYITSLVQRWVDGSQPNDGLVLLTTPTAGNNEITYHSSDVSDPSLRPQLTVAVACECGKICLGDDNFIVLSTDSDAELGGLAFQDTDLVEYDRDADTGTLFLDSLSAGLSKKVDALHVLENGNLILSVDGGTTFAGLSVASEDLFEYDPVAGTAAMYIEADVHFESKMNIISAHILDNGNVVLSTDGSATLGGLDFSDKDLVEYNRFTGEASIYFDGDATTLSQRISALHILNDGRLVLTADGDTTLGGLSFRQDQLIEYDPVADSAILFFDGETLFTETSEKIRALHIGSGSGSSVPSIGTQHVLLVVGDSTNLASEDSDRKTLFESWDYRVTVIDDGASQASFDTAAATNDVVYVSGTIIDGTLGNKLTGSSTAVVNEDWNMLADFGFSENEGYNTTYNKVTTEASHFITEPFAGAEVTIFTPTLTMETLNGTMSADLQHPAKVVGAVTVLATLDAGAARWDASPAPARRAHVPFQNADISQLTADGLTLMRRSIEWAAGANIAPNVYLSTDSDAILGGLSFQDTDLVKYQPSADLASLYLDSLAAGLSKRVDALHVLANGNLVLSTRDDATFGGLDFKSEDLIEYDPVAGTATMYLEAAVHFDSMKDIISVHVLDNGNVVLSTNGSAVLGGLAFSDRDLVEYDREAGTASVFFDGDAVSLSQRISAVHIQPNGNIILAPEADTTLGGLDFGPDQLVEYNPSLDLAVLYFDGETLFAETSEKVRSVHIGPGGGGGGTFYLDEFNAIGYSGNDGDLNWSNDWQEWGDDGNVTGGKMRVVACPSGLTTSCLRFGIEEKDAGVSRIADLDGAASATLSFDWRRSGDYYSNDFTVEVRKDGGTWHQLLQLPDGYETSVHSESLTIPSTYFSANTEIRFIPKDWGDGYLYVDNVRINVVGGSGAGTACPADYIPDTLVSEFSWEFEGIGDPWGLTFLPPGVSFNGVAAPADGAWLVLDKGDKDFTMFDLLGTNLTAANTSINEPRGVAYIDSGTWANHLAVAEPGLEEIIFTDLNAATQGSISTVGITQLPLGVSFIKNSQSGSYDGHLAISSDKNAAGNSQANISIVDQDGNLKSVIDISGFAILPAGVAHIPGKDKFLVIENTGPVYIVGFDGTLHDQYNSNDWGTIQTQSIAINPLTSTHGILDKGTKEIIELGLASCIAGGGGGGSCDGTFRDEFNARSLTGSDGTLSWSTDWLEVGESNGPTSGDIQVMNDQSNYQLRTRDNDNGGEGVEREVDLSGATSAKLSYDYRRMNLDSASDYTAVEVSSNGAAGPWNELVRHQGSGNDGSYVTAEHPLTGFISANTRIRFKTSSSMGGTDTVWFDNVEIACTP